MRVGHTRKWVPAINVFIASGVKRQNVAPSGVPFDIALFLSILCVFSGVGSGPIPVRDLSFIAVKSEHEIFAFSLTHVESLVCLV